MFKLASDICGNYTAVKIATGGKVNLPAIGKPSVKIAGVPTETWAQAAGRWGKLALTTVGLMAATQAFNMTMHPKEWESGYTLKTSSTAR